MGGKKLSDGKTIGGKGRLTDAIISKLTTFYGNAIRANSHNVNEMRQAVWAVWAHTSSTDDEPKHWFCPKAKIAGAWERVTLFGGVKRRIHQIPSVVNNNRADVKITIVTLGTGDLPSVCIRLSEI
ncbi:uncharacterized protein TNCV_1470431 [Trichonephila clavipes]|nr:uncharacterized protein TNCV_1470431 [Trichonephila clavipes]